MQSEIMSIENAEKIADYPKQVERGNYWKTEYDKVVIMCKEREKIILGLMQKKIKESGIWNSNFTRKIILKGVYLNER